VTIPLRPYQEEAIARVREASERVARVLMVLATGGGKTVIASWIVRTTKERGATVLFVAHRREIIAQTFCKLVRNGIPIDEVGVVMGDTPLAAGKLFPEDLGGLSDDALWAQFGRRRPWAKVQVGSVDTLRRRAKLGKVDLIIIDEAHRALAPSYVALVAAYPEAFVLGLTATPYRADGKGLDELFDDLVVIARPQLLIDLGFLVEPEVWSIPPSGRPDLAGVKTRGGDYEIGALSGAMNRAELVGDIVDHWQRHAAGVRTVAFACTVEHSRRIADRFVAAGVAAEHLDGETPTAERDAILGRLERGETLVVSNCGVLCEGWDQPSVKCCILARPTKSTGLYLQQAGRILRPWQGQRAIILDHAGCARDHGLPQDDREFTLAGDSQKAKNAGAAGARECPECYRAVPNDAKVCPGCGAELAEGPGGTDVAEVDGRLVKLAATQEERDLELVYAIEAEWRKKNAKRAAPMKPGWILHRFKEKAGGRRPPRSYKLPTLTEEELRARGELERLLRDSVTPGQAHARLAAMTKEVPHVAPAANTPTVAPARPCEQTPELPIKPMSRGQVHVELAAINGDDYMPEPEDWKAPASPTDVALLKKYRDPWDPRPAPVKAPAPRVDVELEEVAF
jgi:DNA repair protein RadD